MATTKTAKPQPPKALPLHSTMNPASLPATTAAQTVTSLTNANNLSGTTGAFSVKNFFKMMKYERFRLITYLLYGHQWPKMEVISPTELAKAGFFYIHDDAVKCAFCKGIMSNWQHGDDAMELHQFYFPDCPYIRGEYCGNMPFEIDPDINSSSSKPSSNSSPASTVQGRKLYSKSNLPDFPRFTNPLNRSQSFSSPNWKSTAVSAEDLVDAGFFYTGREDGVRCFHCGGVLKNWAPGEVPLEEHAKFFPECHFLVSTRSQTYIEFVQFKNQIIDLRRKLDTPPAVLEADIACMRAITYQNFLNMKQSASRVMNRLEKRNSQRGGNPVRSNANHNAGHQSGASASEQSSPSSPSSGDLNFFLQKYLSKFSFLTDCQKLFQYLTSLEIMPSTTSPTSPEAPAAGTVHSAEAAGSSNSSTANENTALNVSSSSSSSNNSGSEDSLTSRNGISISIFSLDDGTSESGFEDDSCQSSVASSDEEGEGKPLGKNALQCIICCNRQIEIVFVPCGHQLACRKCSEKITSCPICRFEIESKVRTYFANC